MNASQALLDRVQALTSENNRLKYTIVELQTKLVNIDKEMMEGKYEGDSVSPPLLDPRGAHVRAGVDVDFIFSSVTTKSAMIERLALQIIREGTMRRFVRVNFEEYAPNNILHRRLIMDAVFLPFSNRNY